MLISNQGPKIYSTYLIWPLHFYYPPKLTAWKSSPYAPSSFRYCINWNYICEKASSNYVWHVLSWVFRRVGQCQYRSQILLILPAVLMVHGMAFFVSCFYKRSELLFQVELLVSAGSLARAFGGFLAVAFT